MVPIVGGAAVELVSAVFGPPLKRRQQKWFEKLADVVRTLQERDIAVDEPEFVSAVAAASRIALGTHLEEKLTMLKAAIFHAAMPDRPADIMTMRFLRFVEELDPEHFVLLVFMRDPKGHFASNAIAEPNIAMGGLGSIYQQSGIAIENLDLVRRDVTDRGLADGGSWNTMMTANGAWAPRTTDLGNQLLDFVTFIDVEQPSE